ncbi:MAG: hypothetical protein COB95_01400 [Nitrosopumilales archaeon]|nr:MAG: hypothetical protein COB95_01400 [Nitrosopumilales archaeon]
MELTSGKVPENEKELSEPEKRDAEQFDQLNLGSGDGETEAKADTDTSETAASEKDKSKDGNFSVKFESYG